MTGILMAFLLAAAITTGLVAGLLWSFVVAVMPALRTAPDETFVQVMRRINRSILNGPFLLCFTGALGLTAAAVLTAFLDGRVAVIVPVLAALVLYAATIGITRAVHIPLNNALGAAAEEDEDPAAVRAAFEARWVRWNVIRTGTATAALAALGWAMLAA